MNDTTLGESIKDYMDSIAPPISLDEIRSNRSASPAEAPRQSVGQVRAGRRWMTLAACVLLGVGLVGVYFAATHPNEHTAGPAGASIEEPTWFTAISPHLPPGFDHVAVFESSTKYVKFVAFDPTSSKSLSIIVSRAEMSPDPSGSMTLDQAMTAAWSEPGGNVSLPDGRQIGVACYFRPLPDGQTGCPPVNGVATDPEDLRTLALALATEVSPDDLPVPSDELEHVSGAAIRAAARAATDLPEYGDLVAPHYASAFVQYGGDTTSLDFLMVRTNAGFYPPLDPETPRGSATVNERRSTWQAMPDGSVWVVWDTPTAGFDVADRILDAAQRQADPASRVDAQVTGGPPDRDVIAIDRGSNVGIRVGMPVVNGDALVGKITSVTPDASEVLLVTDPRFAIAATVAPTDTNRFSPPPTGIASGTNDNSLSWTPANGGDASQILAGNIIVTAGGTDSLAPAGIRIGSVTQTSPSQPASGTRTIDIKPSVDATELTNVDVLLYQPLIEPAPD